MCSWVFLLLSQLVTRTKKIFVGGLSVNTTIEDVKQYFDQFGKVSVEVIGMCLCAQNVGIKSEKFSRYKWRTESVLLV